MKKVIVCKVCQKELKKQSADCENTNCPYKEINNSNNNKGSFWGDALGDGCLGEFGGCLLLPFKWLFQIIIGFFKVIGKVLSAFDD